MGLKGGRAEKSRGAEVEVVSHGRESLEKVKERIALKVVFIRKRREESGRFAGGQPSNCRIPRFRSDDDNSY